MRSTGFAVALVVLAMVSGCGEDQRPVATAAGGGTAVPGEASEESITTSTSAPDQDEPETTTTGRPALDPPFEEVMTSRCREVFDGVSALSQPETVGDIRALMAGAIGLHDSWLTDARQLTPPGVPVDEWTTHLDRVDAALRDVDAYITGLTAGLPDSEPVETLYVELSSPEGRQVDAALNDALSAVNALLDLDCFDVAAPEG